MESNGTRMGKIIFKKTIKCKESGYPILRFIMHNNNQCCVLQLEGRHINQWNRTEIPETDPHKYAQLIFWTKVPKQFNGGKIAFSTNDAGVMQTATGKRESQPQSNALLKN